MNWTELLKSSVDAAFHPTEGMFKMVEPGEMNWKPETGSNWMTAGQLLMHLTTACGHCCKGFVTGDWGMPEGQSAEDMSPEDMMPPAEKMPTVETVEQALDLLAADKALAHEMIEKAGEEDLDTRMVGAPWAPEMKMPLGAYLLQMVGHLSQHKDQLYYYLKLKGKPVHTGVLWGM